MPTNHNLLTCKGLGLSLLACKKLVKTVIKYMLSSTVDLDLCSLENGDDDEILIDLVILYVYEVEVETAIRTHIGQAR